MAAAKDHAMSPRVACGAGTDHIALEDLKSFAAIKGAYETQMSTIENAGGQVILMASRAFPAMNASSDEYHAVYRHLIDNAKDPVILHWLGICLIPHYRDIGGIATLIVLLILF